MMTTGERIRAARLSADNGKGITQKKLGELCGIAEPTIRRYELGKLNPKIGTLMKISNALQIPFEEIAFSDEDLKTLANNIKPALEILRASIDSVTCELVASGIDPSISVDDHIYAFMESFSSIGDCLKMLNEITKASADDKVKILQYVIKLNEQ